MSNLMILINDFLLFIDMRKSLPKQALPKGLHHEAWFYYIS